MDKQLTYKCPNCGGAIAFDPGAQKMKCPYCDTEFEMDALRDMDAALNEDGKDAMHWDTSSGTQWQAGETDGMRIYACQSCGGEIIADENTGALHCPYCGNPVVMIGTFAGDLRPDLVVPFKLDKKAAKEALNRHLTGKKLLPRVFQSQNHIDEIRGVYIPFWLFDTEADAHLRFKGTMVHAWSDSDFDYTETEFYSVVRGGSITYTGIPVDGASKIPNDLTESLEPYDLTEAVDFQTAYLAGYLADKYDVPKEDCIERANERIRQTTERVIRQETCGDYASVTLESSSIRFQNGRVRYVLLPAWILNTSWNGQNYQFAMNGQTGKFIGNLPMDKGAYWKYKLLYTGIFALISLLVLFIVQSL